MSKEVISDLISQISSGGQELPDLLRQFADVLKSPQQIKDLLSTVDPQTIIEGITYDEPDSTIPDPDSQKIKYILKILNENCQGCGATHGNNYIQKDANAACAHCDTLLQSEVVLIIDPDEVAIRPGDNFDTDVKQEHQVETQTPEGYKIYGFVEYGGYHVPLFESKKDGLIHPDKSVSWLVEQGGNNDIELETGHTIHGLSVANSVLLKPTPVPYYNDPYEYGGGSVVTRHVVLQANNTKNVNITLHPGIVGDFEIHDIKKYRYIRIQVVDQGDMAELPDSQENRNSLIFTGSVANEGNNSIKLNTYGDNPVVIISPGANLNFDNLVADTVVVAPGASIKATNASVNKLIIIQPNLGGSSPVAALGGKINETITLNADWYNKKVADEMAAIFGYGVNSSNEIDI